MIPHPLCSILLLALPKMEEAHIEALRGKLAHFVTCDAALGSITCLCPIGTYMNFTQCGSHSTPNPGERSNRVQRGLRKVELESRKFRGLQKAQKRRYPRRVESNNQEWFLPSKRCQVWGTQL